MTTHPDYTHAILDFHEARRKAALREILARLTGESIELLSYEEVRQKLKAMEVNTQRLTDIPLDAIIGSVGRYTDFTRDFLPRRDSDKTRWTSVMTKALGLKGLPPIEVYQIGEAYFVKDGNHRVSVARQLGASHIQAYVTELRTRVPLTPDTKPDELIIKAEQVNFLELTRLDQLCPQVDLSVTIPGQYPILEEHISVHRYFMGIEQKRPIPYEEAVAHWYDEVYLPVVEIIRQRGILRYFPGRTETDLYLWLAKHRADLEETLGWKIETEAVAEDLVSRFAPDFQETMSRLTQRILDAVTPDPLESGPPVGQWRQKQVKPRSHEYLFENILVTLGKDKTWWYALDQALIIAHREEAQLRGLHVVPRAELREAPYINALKTEFAQRCSEANISGELAIEVGRIARQVCERSQWADLVISNLAHPPGSKPLERLGSGFRTMVRRCPRPILAVPGTVTALNSALLAYTDSPKANEALFIATYLAGKWGIHLAVLTIDHEGQSARQIQEPARKYLEDRGVQAQYILREAGPRAKIILNTASENQCALILIGGYKASPVVEVVLGSVVDQVLRETRVPVLLCR